uniref:Transcobalamin-2 n=1 Tax=Myotis myotis TaxID=51298 RepID=A0A7J7S423_MYOMY|nr:transcobalamin 2 [Myotis myotis]
MGRLGALLLLLGALGALADICNIPEVDSSLVQSLGQRLLPWMDQLSLEHLNPSIYVGLRLSSVEASTKEAFYLHSLNSDLRHRITLAIRTAQEKVLKAQTPEGYFGNVYSTPLALQLLMTSPMPGAELGTACLNARAALLASLQDGAFQNALMISQLLPVLNHKSYVDLISPDCLAPRVTLEPATVTPSLMQVPEFIHVMLKVPSVWPPYRHSISVPAGSSLEEVLMKAQELGGFMYGTQASLSGPYLTSVMGKEVGEREFWQLIRAPDTPLQQGIADYRPKDGETIELRLVTW